MIRAVAFGLLAALVWPAASTDFPKTGGRVEWEDAAATSVLDSDGQPPILVPAYRAEHKMVVWVWPRKGMADARDKTFGTAWDAIGPHDLIVLLRHPLADHPPHANTGIPCETYVVRCDWRGKGTVVAGPVRGDPGAVVWVPSRHCGVVAITDTTGYYRHLDPVNEAPGGMACDLYLLREGGGLTKIGHSDGMNLLADAGDGRHVFALENVIYKNGPRAYIDWVFWPCLTSIDVRSGERRVLVKDVDLKFLSVRDRHAFVLQPHHISGDPNKDPGTFVGPNLTDVAAPVLRASLDGRSEVFLSATPPRAVMSVVMSDRGTFSVVCPRSKNGDFFDDRLITLGCGTSSPTSWALAGVGMNWPAPCAGFLPDGKLVTADLDDSGKSGVVSLFQGRPPSPTQLLRTDDPLASGAPFDLNVIKLGKVKVRYAGHIPAEGLRPWMIVAAQDQGPGYAHAEDWSAGKSITGAVVYPMQVGTRSYLYVNGLTVRAGAEPAGGGDWAAAHKTVMVFQPLGDIDLLKPQP
jgi:hypothetical protein